MPSEADQDDRFRDAVSERFRIHERCFAEKDARPLAETFIAPDAVWDFQGFPPLQGRKAVLAFFEDVVRTSIVAIDLLNWRADGAMGWSLVDYVVTFGDEAPSMTLRTVFIWSRSSGDWLVETAVGYQASGPGPGPDDGS